MRFSNMNERTEKRLEGMTPDEKALFVSKHLMMAEAALESLKPDVEEMRAKGDSTRMAEGYCGMLQGYHLIKAGHQCLTVADERVFDRPVPASR